MQRWEYRIEDAGFNLQWTKKGEERDAREFQARFDSAGEWGWELVSYEAVPIQGKFTTEVNSYKYVAFFKRPAIEPPSPRDAAWHPDPFERHEQRHWDGERWSEHVVDGGEQSTDPPQ